MLTVRYIGPDAAILGGTYIYTGETRTVSAGQLQVALEQHPAEHFEIVLAQGFEVTIEQELPIDFPTNDDEPPTTDDQPPATDEPPTTEEPAVVNPTEVEASIPGEPIAEEPTTPAAPVVPAAPAQRRRP